MCSCPRYYWRTKQPTCPHCQQRAMPAYMEPNRPASSTEITDPSKGDLKAGRAGAKAPLHWIPLWALKGVARVFDYGARKYAPGNWLKAAREEGRAAYDDYLSAQLRHVADSQEPEGLEDDQLLANLSRLDNESGLPHIDHMICGLIMLRGILIKRGLLPADPGRGNEPVRPTAQAGQAASRGK